jgi:RNA polymerase sigma-70 factor (ECF subfamily)
MSEQSFRALIDDARNGDDAAAQAIVEQYTGALVAVARRQIGPRLAQRLDADDVVQSAYRSLFVRMRDGEYELGSGQDLWKLLVTMTLNKVRRHARHHATQRRNMHLEQGGAEHLEGMVVDPQPGPADAAELVDETAALLSSLSAQDRPIVELRLQGLSTAEIAQELGRAERSVRRILERIRERLEQSIGQ